MIMEIKDRNNMSAEEAQWLLENEPGVEVATEGLRSYGGEISWLMKNGNLCFRFFDGSVVAQPIQRLQNSRWSDRRFHVVKKGEREPELETLTGMEALRESIKSGEIYEGNGKWYRAGIESLFESSDRGESWISRKLTIHHLRQHGFRMTGLWKYGYPFSKTQNGLEALDRYAKEGKTFEKSGCWFHIKGRNIAASSDKGKTWVCCDRERKEWLATGFRIVDRSEWFDRQPETKPKIEPLPESLSRDTLEDKFGRGGMSCHHLATELSEFLQGVMDRKIEAALKAKDARE